MLIHAYDSDFSCRLRCLDLASIGSCFESRSPHRQSLLAHLSALALMIPQEIKSHTKVQLTWSGTLGSSGKKGSLSAEALVDGRFRARSATEDSCSATDIDPSAIRFRSGMLVLYRWDVRGTPYPSSIPLNGRSLSEDVIELFKFSEQIPSQFICGENTLTLVQAMPGGTLIDFDDFPLDIRRDHNEDFQWAEKNWKIANRISPKIFCTCSQERSQEIYESFVKSDSRETNNENVTITCDFCKKEYQVP